METDQPLPCLNVIGTVAFQVRRYQMSYGPQIFNETAPSNRKGLYQDRTIAVRARNQHETSTGPARDQHGTTTGPPRTQRSQQGLSGGPVRVSKSGTPDSGSQVR